MIDIEKMLSSLSNEDMAKIRSIAESLTDNKSPEQNKTQSEAPVMPEFSLDGDTMKKIMGIAGRLNKSDYRTRLIEDLKPMLSDDRKQKADEAVKFLQLMEVLPLLRGMF